MEKWKFDEKRLKKLYKEENSNLKMSYKEFRKMAESFANELIDKVKKDVKNEKIT